ncbi:hypothetical protein [Modestobacter sp. URMC 112]
MADRPDIRLQSSSQPTVVLEALKELVSEATESLFIAAAYTTYAGMVGLVDALSEQIGATGWSRVRKTLVTSLEFGHTDPEALTLARGAGFQVLLANSRPGSNWHPKLYLFEARTGFSAVVGSANASSRALYTNTEIVSVHASVPTDTAWALIDELQRDSVPATDERIEAYGRQRTRTYVRPPAQDPDLPIPPIAQQAPGSLPSFPDTVRSGAVDPGAFDRFWVEGGAMSSSDSHHQLESPRYGCRFFGSNFDDHQDDKQLPIATLSLVWRAVRWDDRELRWHGDNGMERVNLITRAMGGPNYVGQVILFKRRADGAFDLEVTPQGSATATAWLNASADKGALFRVGGRSPRRCGLI